jgi:hypothetical protein
MQVANYLLGRAASRGALSWWRICLRN